jgi:uncharacterized membrane protein YdfJ with MMPL/SSD domain
LFLLIFIFLFLFATCKLNANKYFWSSAHMRCSSAAFLDWFTRNLCKYRFVVLLFWLLLAGGSAYFIMEFVKNTTEEFSPPDGTQAATAESAFGLQFPGTHDVSYLNVFIRLEDHVATGTAIYDVEAVKVFCSTLLAAFRAHFGTAIVSAADYFELMPAGMTSAAANLISPDLRAMALPLILNADFVTKLAAQYGEEMQSIVAINVPVLNGTATAVCNGIPIFVTGIVKEAQDELGMMDAIAIPLAMIIMSITLKSLRTMILPLITIGFTLAISFGAMYFVSLGMGVSSTTPSLMMSLCIAMSIDYNLFILSRYREELVKGSGGMTCITNVLRTAGHTILVSGVTLLFCLLGLVFFPLNMLQSFGVGCGFAIVISLLVSLTFAPALLMTFPKFFEASVKPTKFPTWVPEWIARYLNSTGYSTKDYISSVGEKSSAMATNAEGITAERSESYMGFTPRQGGGGGGGGYGAVDLDKGESANGPSTQQRRSESATRFSGNNENANHNGPLLVTMPTTLDAQYYHRTRSVFYRLHPIVRSPWNYVVLFVVLSLTLALGYEVLRFKTTDSFDSYLPRGSDVANNFVSFVESFGFGYTQPYHIMLSGLNGDQVVGPNIPIATSEAFFVYFQGFLKLMVADDSVAPVRTREFLGPLNIAGEWTNYSMLRDCFELSLSCNMNVGGFLAAPNSMVAYGEHPSAMYTILITSFDPMGNLGDPFYKHVMTLGDQFKASVLANASFLALNTTTTAEAIQQVATHYTLYFGGVGPSSMDAIDTVYRLFPIIIGVSCGSVLVVVGIAFRSIIMPLRSVVSIAATQLFVFGLVVVTYQSPGIMNWMGWGSVQSFGAVSWTAPVVAFSVIVGVALDYDIFLITRVVELVEDEGLRTSEAVLHALCSTGRIITSAGIIMAVAFFGLLLSSTQILNLLGFFMVAAVLFDTFIVRTLLVPSLMSILGKWNWYPRQLDQHDSTTD